jgi:hypothetical protein
MNRSCCDREAEIIVAMRRGALCPELEKHASACPICSDIAVVTKFLQTQAAVEPVPLDPNFLWWKAQLANKQLALERATRSIALVERIAYWGIGAAALWLMLAPGRLGSILGALSNPEIWPTGALGQSSLLMGVAALIFTLLGSWYLVRSEN